MCKQHWLKSLKKRRYVLYVNMLIFTRALHLHFLGGVQNLYLVTKMEFSLRRWLQKRRPKRRNAWTRVRCWISLHVNKREEGKGGGEAVIRRGESGREWGRVTNGDELNSIWIFPSLRSIWITVISFSPPQLVEADGRGKCGDGEKAFSTPPTRPPIGWPCATRHACQTQG